MQVTELKNEGLKREFEVTLQADDINKKVEARLSQVAKSIKMPGFRPGKVPLAIVKKKHGKDILGEVLQSAVADSSRTVMDERDLQPALQPKIEISSFDPEKEGADLVYNLSFEIYPEVPEVDLGKVTLEKMTIEVSKKDVDDGIERLREGQSNYVPLKKARAAKMGDAVLIDFEGKIDGVAFSGGTAKDFQLVLGSGQFIPGFEDQLVGAKKGETVTVKVTFPEQYGSADLAGKATEFTVTVNDVLQSELPEVDDAFAARLGLETVEKLRDAISEQIAKDFEVMTRTRVKKDLFDALDKNHKFKVPEGMVEMEFGSISESVKNTEEGAKKPSKKEEEKQQEEYKSLAERRVRLGIILADIGKKNALNVSDDELRRAVFAQARNYPGQEQRVIEFYQKNRDALEQLKGPILEDKVVDYVLGKVKTTDKKVTTAELLKLDQED